MTDGPLDVHPLDMLRVEEVIATRDLLRDAGELPDGAAIAHLVLDEPSKEGLASWTPGDEVDRCMRALIVPGPELTMVEVVVSLTDGAIRDRRVIEGMRPALLLGETFGAILACHAHPDYVAALARRGITDVERVQVDPWPAGSFGYDAEAGRRIARCISFLREFDTDNGYARPIEGLIVHVDVGRGEVIEVIDHFDGVDGRPDPVPLAPQHARYTPDDVGPLRAGLRPIEIAQPDGPSFTLEGNHLRWQRWDLRIGFDPYEGLVLHQVGYDDAATGRMRPILHRASVSEMVVPYGAPGEIQGWKNAFDAGEWGLGRMTQSLTLGCDCLGEVTYMDAVMATEQGEPWFVPNAICLHEEDAGIGWKHVDLFTGATEVRRSRRMVISHIATVGNYEYGFYWYLYLDGTIQLEVKLTGIMSPQGVRPTDDDGWDVSDFATLVAPGVAAPVHQHLFCVRLDLDVDGAENRVEEVEAEVVDAGPDNPWANAFRARRTLLERESDAQREVNAATSRSWRVSSTTKRNSLGGPTAYRLLPNVATPTLHARPESSVARRAGFARHNLWVTPYDPGERRAAGKFPNQHEGGAGLPEWTAADRPIVDRDIVCWYTFGVTHFPRPEDWPVMPVESTGFLLQPVGFFDRNPALDVPPAPPAACHHD